MTAHSYLRWPSDLGSWHVITKVDDTGWHLRCGRVITTDNAKGSDHLPYGEKSCESCAAGVLRDEDGQAATNDAVGPPTDVSDDPVPA